MKDFRQKGLISKDISFHAQIKKSNYKSFRHAMRKIRITKKDECAKVEEVNRNILGISNSYSLKTGKSADFKQALPYALFPVHLSISNPNGSRQHTATNNLNYILLQDLENHTYEFSSDYAIVVNAILNKPSTYSEFAELFLSNIPRGYGRVDIITDCYKTKSIKRLIRKDPYSITSFKGSK